MGIPAVHVYRLRPGDQRPGHTIVSTEESWGRLLARPKAEGERRATP